MKQLERSFAFFTSFNNVEEKKKEEKKKRIVVDTYCGTCQF